MNHPEGNQMLADLSILGDINWIAVALSTVAISLLGGVWFTLFFGKAYARALGKESSPQEKPAPIFIAGPLVCGFVTVVAMAILIQAFQIQSVRDAIIFGSIVGAGLLAATTVNTGINPNIPRPLLYGLVSGGYFLVSGWIISLILVAMG